MPKTSLIRALGASASTRSTDTSRSRAMLRARLMLVNVFPSPGSALETMMRRMSASPASAFSIRGRLIRRYWSAKRRSSPSSGRYPASRKALRSMLIRLKGASGFGFSGYDGQLQRQRCDIRARVPGARSSALPSPTRRSFCNALSMRLTSPPAASLPSRSGGNPPGSKQPQHRMPRPDSR